MGDFPGCLQGKCELCWYALEPAQQCFGCGQRVEAGVDFDTVELCGVMAELLVGRSLGRIEDAAPVGKAPRRGADAQSSQIPGLHNRRLRY